MMKMIRRTQDAGRRLQITYDKIPLKEQPKDWAHGEQGGPTQDADAKKGRWSLTMKISLGSRTTSHNLMQENGNGSRNDNPHDHNGKMDNNHRDPPRLYVAYPSPSSKLPICLSKIPIYKT